MAGFGNFIITEEQAARIHSGDVNSAWEFIQNNRDQLMNWARSFIRNQICFLPVGFAEPDDLIDQVFLELSDYDLDRLPLVYCIQFSFFHAVGLKNGYVHKQLIPLDAPINISSRSGETIESTTLGNLLASKEPSPTDILEQEEHLLEVLPLIYGRVESYLKTRKRSKETYEEELREIIEAIFVGMTLEEVQEYAKNLCAA